MRRLGTLKYLKSLRGQFSQMTIIKDVTGDYVAAVATEAEWKNPNGIIITVPKKKTYLLSLFWILKEAVLSSIQK